MMKKFDSHLHDAIRIKRWHNKDTIRTQTVGEHTCGMITIALYLSGGTMSERLWLACLKHDFAEIATGDIPRPVLDKSAALRVAVHDMTVAFDKVYFDTVVLTEQEQRILDMADSLDGMMFCAVEVSMGNMNMAGIVEHYSRKLNNMLGKIDDDLFARACHVRTEALKKAGMKNINTQQLFPPEA